MNDIGKAFIMGVNALLFVMALTIAILLYYFILGHINDIFLTTDYSNQGDSIFGVETVADTRRVVQRAEIMAAILSLPSNPTGRVVVRNGGASRTFTASGENILVSGVGEFQVNGSSFRNVLESTFGDLDTATTTTYHMIVSNTNTANRSQLIYERN